MKTAALILSIILCSTFFSLAQSEKELKKHQAKISESKEKGTFILSLDTIFNSGTAYGVLHAKRKGFAKEYSLFSLNGTELLDVVWECTDDSKDCWYAFLFLQSGKRGEVGNSLGINIEKMILEGDFVKDNAINPTNENKFVMRNPPKYSNKPQQQVVIINNGGSNNNIYETVDRNRNSMMHVMGDEINQDFKVIGKCNKSSEAVNGKILTVISFYLPNGTKIAEATQEDVNSKSYKVVTMKDNSTHYVTTTFFGKEAEDIAKYLSANYYL